MKGGDKYTICSLTFIQLFKNIVKPLRSSYGVVANFLVVMEIEHKWVHHVFDPFVVLGPQKIGNIRWMRLPMARIQKGRDINQVQFAIDYSLQAIPTDAVVGRHEGINREAEQSFQVVLTRACLVKEIGAADVFR